MTAAEAKAAVRSRDGFRCRDCGRRVSGRQRKLDVHRLTPGSLYSVDGCVTLCRKCHKRRHGLAYSCAAAKIDRAVYHHAKLVVARKESSLTDYLSELLRPLVNRDYTKAIKEMAQEESSKSE